MTREEWLSERRTGIGGSDAAAACGLSKWKTPLELYLDKRGELHTDENEPMRWGNLLEPVVRQEYANRTGRTVVVPVGIIRHPTVPFALMTPDGIADESRVLQVKTARTAEGWGEAGSADVPLEYMLQVQHEMFVTQLPVADLAVLVGGQDFRIYTVEADADLQSMLVAREAEFWAHVINSLPPEPVSRDDVRRRWRISTGGKFEADHDVVMACELLAEWKQQASKYDTAAERLTTILQATMKDAAELVDDGGNVLATWKNIRTNPRFDLERFKDEQPELYRQYLRDVVPQRRFLLKVKGNPECQQLLLPEPMRALPMAHSS